MKGLKIALWSLWAPVRGLAAATEQRRFVWPLVLVSLLSLGYGVLAAQRLDFAGPAEESLEKTPDFAKLTPHEREEKIAQAVKLGVVGTVARNGLWPSFSALLAAVMLWLGFKVAGGRPGFAATFAAVAHSLLPDALKALASLPALLLRPGPLSEADLAQLLPSSLAALAPEKVSERALALLNSVDLFSLASLALLVVGMAHAAQVSFKRSTLVVAVLWVSFVLVFRFALPSFFSAS